MSSTTAKTMAGATASAAGAGAAPPPPPPPPPSPLPGQVVEVLDNQISQLFANVHPVLLVSLVPLFFNSLVDEPVATLLGLAPTTLLVQTLYCTLCLPSTGSSAPVSSSKPKPGQHKTKSTKPAQDIWSKLVPAFLSLVLTFFLTAPVLYITAILFGAPLISHLPHTALLAVHLALLTTPQLFYVHGLDATTWLRLFSLQQPLDAIYGMSLGACAGAWVGAIPIPLDWDREWQKWPVTIICGMYAGAVLGSLLSGYVFRGKRVEMR